MKIIIKVPNLKQVKENTSKVIEGLCDVAGYIILINVFVGMLRIIGKNPWILPVLLVVSEALDKYQDRKMWEQEYHGTNE